jgi:hypothetical protein
MKDVLHCESEYNRGAGCGKTARPDLYGRLCVNKVPTMTISNSMGVEFFKNLTIILLACSPLSTWGGDFEFSVGGGYQYIGIIGTQFAFKEDDKKYFISLGLLGVSVGMQSACSNNENHSVGFSVGKVAGVSSADTEYGFITYNYHFSGFQNNGWVFPFRASFKRAYPALLEFAIE